MRRSPTSAPPSARPSRVPRAESGDGASPLLSLNAGALVRALFAQSAAVWFIILYLFFEYVRPQSIYSWIDVAPWSFLALLGAVVLVVLEQRVDFGSKGLWAMVALFTLVIFASSVTAYSPSASWDKREFWLNWVLLIFVVGGGLRTRTEFILVLLSFVLWNLKMSQHGVQGWVFSGFSVGSYGVGGGPGWFQNSGEFGIQMCIFLPLVGYLTHGLWPHLSRNKKLIMVAITLTGVISIVASSSRGGVIGAGGVALWMVLRSPNRVRTIFIVSVLAAFTWLALPPSAKARYTEMGQDQTSQSRLTYWQDGIEIAKEHPLLGIGYKNWPIYYYTFYNPKGELPHNYYIEAVAELGFTGFFVLNGVFFAYFMENASTRRRTRPGAAGEDRLLHSLTYGLDGAMIGFMVSGFFVSVLYYPFIWMNVALCLALARVARTAARQHPRPVVRGSPAAPKSVRTVRFVGA